MIATLPLGGKPEFAAGDEHGRVFVNIEDTNETVAIDARRLGVEKRWPRAPGETPTGLSMDPAMGRLFVGCHNEKMVVLDSNSGKVIATLPIGKGVDATEFDPGTKLAFSSNGEGTLTVVAAAGEPFHVVENVPTKRGARTMALDPKTHAVYLAAADYEPAPAPTADQPRPQPKMIPGTFVILKFERTSK